MLPRKFTVVSGESIDNQVFHTFRNETSVDKFDRNIEIFADPFRDRAQVTVVLDSVRLVADHCCK